jgi:CubicO group peptidase (beta-lactamase class C family)
VEVGRADDVAWRAAFGRLTYAEDAPRVTEDTIFDLASLTKVIATTTIAMQGVDAGTISLSDHVTDRIGDWRGLDRELVTIADLLEHASGLTAYLPFFRDHQGRDEFQRAICTLPLEYTPRSQSIYSDLGFILLGFILEDVNNAPLAQQFEYPDLRFNPPREWRERTAPTELDLWRGRLLQGEVHDENTWALGGAAGHAGLFGTAAASGTFARLLLRGLKGGRSIARPETLARFTTTSNVPGSSRALGWDTMLTSSSCGNRLSGRAIGHTGFTGTSLWIDPQQDLYVVLLTNRVHPTRENNAIQPVRRAFHDAVVAAMSLHG